MDVTPKLQRKSSLSLSTRLKQKRHNASPQNRLKTSTSCSVADSKELNASSEALQRSPSVISHNLNGGIECTPPHKKMIMNLDDSLEYSPKVFDTSFSPTCLLSQTLAIDSPEVGWKWNRRSSEADSKCEVDDNKPTRTPDSAYAVDSYASVSSNSTELVSNVGNRGDPCHYRLSHSRNRENQRKLYEQELRRIEMSKVEEKLKERCAKLQKQLKSGGSERTKGTESQSLETIYKKNEKTTSDQTTSLSDFTRKTTVSTAFINCIPTVEISDAKSEKAEIMVDFFNDTDSDCLLIAATQEIESKMNVKTQPVLINVKSSSTQSITSSECISVPHANTAPAATTTPPKCNTPLTKSSCSNSSGKEKRSSFYMKFLEDDCPDDWFVSLDEVILQATQTTKPRNSLQRYKSMPAETISKSNDSSSYIKDNNENCIIDLNSSKRKVINSGENIASSNFSRIKRHSSTHTLSPTNSHYKSRRQL